jgi:isopenicillin N synthase-like dioxygenase
MRIAIFKAAMVVREVLLLLLLPHSSSAEAVEAAEAADIVPIIDASALFAQDSHRHEEEQRKLKQALEISGFLLLRDSDISSNLVTDLMSAYKDFFNQSDKLKSTVDMSSSFSNRGWGHAGAERVNVDANADYKEFFDRGIALPEGDPRTSIRYYAPNLWPDNIPNFKLTLDNYFSIAHHVARQLLAAVAESLGQPSSYFEPAFADAPMSLLRGLHYPPRPALATDKDFGIAPHTDYGCLTLVVSDGTPGLEVQTSSGEWLAVTPVRKGDVVVNFGDMLEMWSGGQVKATVHRVRGTSEERLSSAFFFNPTYDTDVSPIMGKSSSNGGQQQEYTFKKTVMAGEYLSKRYDDTYVHLTPDK